MPSKAIVCIELKGGMDAVNFISARDATSVGQVTAFRQSSATHVLDYTEATIKTGDVAKDSAVISNINTTGISVGNLVYGTAVKATRRLTVLSINSGANQVTMSAVSHETLNAGSLTFATATQLFKLNESVSTGRNPAFHSTQAFLRDKFNVADTAPNLSKTKAAVVCNIGPLRKKLFKDGNALKVVGTTTNAVLGIDIPNQLNSHNDQQATWQANAPEGAVEGWGGGIADNFLGQLSGINIPLASVSVSELPAFSAGSTALPFSISPNGLIRKIPGFDGGFTQEANSTTQASLKDVMLQAMTLVNADDDISASAVNVNQLAKDYQSVLNDVMEITDPPANLAFSLAGGEAVNGTVFAKSMKSIAKMILANNPNRGALATRSGNNVTFETEITAGVANRTAGQTLVTITAANHGLFTSNLSTSITSDSVIVLGNPTAIDTSIPAAGYKITLVAGDENDKFTFNGTSTTQLTNVAVNIRLKHNLTISNKVFVEAVGFDSATPVNGYQVTSVPNSTSFVVATTASGAFSPTTPLPCKFKLINVPKQVYFTPSAGFGWDTHNNANHSQLAALDAVLDYYNSLVERMTNADVVTFTISDFGRTVTLNAGGQDHGWGGHMLVFGKSVKGNKVYGEIFDYATNGAHLTNFYFMPTTSVYQYGATLAKWMGSTDAEVLQLFPDLINWNAGERYLGFL